MIKLHNNVVIRNQFDHVADCRLSSAALCIGLLCIALTIGLSRVINLLLADLLIFTLTSTFIIFMFKTFFLAYMYTLTSLTTDDHSLYMTVVSLMTVSFSVIYVEHKVAGIMHFRADMPCVFVYICLALS